MTRTLLVIALSIGLSMGLIVVTPALATARSPERDPTTAQRSIVLDGVPVRLRAGTRQVVTVNRTAGYHARVTYWVRNDSGWIRRLQAMDGRIGYGGLVVGRHRRQGTGTTPLGTYLLPWAFGTQPTNTTWDLGYRRIHRGDFWVQDNASAYYNRYRNQRQGGFRWRLPTSAENGSERLTDYPTQYEFAIVTGFNPEQVRHRGAGIFLHVNGAGATAGCVSAPRWLLKSLVARLDHARVPVIAVGR